MKIRHPMTPRHPVCASLYVHYRGLLLSSQNVSGEVVTEMGWCYVHVCVCTCAVLRLYYVRMIAYTRAHACIHTHTPTHTHTHTRTHTHTCTHARTHTHTHIHTLTHTHTHIHIHKHTYTRTMISMYLMWLSEVGGTWLIFLWHIHMTRCMLVLTHAQTQTYTHT